MNLDNVFQCLQLGNKFRPVIDLQISSNSGYFRILKTLDYFIYSGTSQQAIGVYCNNYLSTSVNQTCI